MSFSTYTSIHLAKRPKDQIIPGETFTSKTNEVPKESDLQKGQVIFQSLYLSLDPAMRGWLNGKPDLYIRVFAWRSFPSTANCYDFLLSSLFRSRCTDGGRYDCP